MLLWIVLAVGAYLLLALLLKEAVATRRLSKIRAELFEEAHPGVSRAERGPTRTLRWTDAFGITNPRERDEAFPPVSTRRDR